MSLATNIRHAAGPLTGYRIIELGGIGPVPYCGMLLADMGAEVIRIDREAAANPIGLEGRFDTTRRGKKSVILDLKSQAGNEAILALAKSSDVLIEGMRPGAAERLGIGPDALAALNPRLVYGRLTGWGQTGTMVHGAGHDINYLALTGLLHAIGLKGSRPVPPLNLVADYGGGTMFLLAGILAALLERNHSGLGQVIDAAMVDGAVSLGTTAFGLLAIDGWIDERGVNHVDSGNPWYDSYATSDGRYVAIAPEERPFRLAFLQALCLDIADFDALEAAGDMDEIRSRLQAVFATRTRDEWERLLADTDACATPVLSMKEAQQHPHLRARQTFCDVNGITQPAPAPRFSRTPSRSPQEPAAMGAHTDEILAELGLMSSQDAAPR